MLLLANSECHEKQTIWIYFPIQAMYDHLMSIEPFNYWTRLGEIQV